jgi:hypothetical protein
MGTVQLWRTAAQPTERPRTRRPRPLASVPKDPARVQQLQQPPLVGDKRLLAGGRWYFALRDQVMPTSIDQRRVAIETGVRG